MSKLRCFECGCLIRKIGAVPPVTYECISCGNIFRATERNLIKAEQAYGKHPVESVSEDRNPLSGGVSLKKMKGER